MRSKKMHDGGKGSKPRPIPDPKKFEENWEKIFGNGKQLNRPKTIYHVAPKQEGAYWTDDPLGTIDKCK